MPQNCMWHSFAHMYAERLDFVNNPTYFSGKSFRIRFG